MVILGGLELVAAGYLLKEIHDDNKGQEERERERRRRRRRHSREDSLRPHRYDDSPPSRPSRPPQQQAQLYPPQQPARPYSAPPPQNRPPMIPVSAVGAPMWHPPPQPQPQPHQGLPPSLGTWPQQQPPAQQMQMQQRPPQWQGQGPPSNDPNNFVPPPLQRPATMYPPPGMYIDMKTGKIQHDMYPPEMKQGKREVSSSPPHRTDSERVEYDRVRENSTSSGTHPLPYASQGYSYSQPQISITPAQRQSQSQSQQGHERPTFSSPALPQGYAELDAETPGRYRPQSYGNEKAPYAPQRGRWKSHSFSGGYEEDVDMRGPPPAYRE